MKTISALLAICAGNSSATGEFPAQRPVTWGFDVSFDLYPNNGWANIREAGDLRRHRAHYDVIVMIYWGPGYIEDEIHFLITCPIYREDNSGIIPISTVPWHGWTAWVSIFCHKRRSEHFNMDRKIHIQCRCQKKIFEYRYDWVDWRHASKCVIPPQDEACISYCVRHIKRLSSICICVLCDMNIHLYLHMFM